MTDVNSVVVVGRLTADVDAVQGGFGYLQNGTAVAKVSVAVNRSKKQGDQWVDECSFFNVTIWGNTAANLRPYLKKGTKVAVKGFLKQDRWQDRQTGQNRSAVSIVAEQVELCGAAQNSGEQQEADQYGQPQGGYNNGGRNAQQQFNQPQNMPSQPDFEEDIPF